MKILMTGADGFLGRECQEELRRRGYVVLTTDKRGNMDYRGDLSDETFVAKLPVVDAVVHAAAVQYVSHDLPLLGREAYFSANNVRATALLTSRYTNQITMFVNIGTSMMYDQNGSAAYSINSKMQGQGVYSISKLTAQSYVDAMPNPTATVIPCIIGGLGREGLFRSFISTMKKRGLVLFPGTGQHKTAMVHVKDVASLVGDILAKSATGHFNAAARNPLSIEEWVAEIESELSLPPVRRIHLPLAPIQLLSSLSGYRLLAREQLLMLAQPHVLDINESLQIGWQPRYDNAKIVRDIAKHIVMTS